MAEFEVNTRGGGSVDVSFVRDRFAGVQIVLHIDQTSNIKNGEDEASLVLSKDELIQLRDHLIAFVTFLDLNPGLGA